MSLFVRCTLHMRECARTHMHTHAHTCTRLHTRQVYSSGIKLGDVVDLSGLSSDSMNGQRCTVIGVDDEYVRKGRMKVVAVSLRARACTHPPTHVRMRAHMGVLACGDICLYTGGGP